MMKILRKNKNDKILRSLYDKRSFINNISRNQEVDYDIIITGIFFSSGIFLTLFLFKHESYNLIQNIIILISSIAPLLIFKTKYFKKKEQIKNISKKINDKISKFEKSNKHLNISENYQNFYNELMILRGGE